MILQQNNISRPILLKYLSEGICQVSFVKVKDGTTRTLLCTLQPDLLPAKFQKSVESVFKPSQDEDLIPVWDITEGKWKSFRISKTELFRTSEELTKQDKSGQDVESSQKEGIEKRKLTAKEQAQKRKEKVMQQIVESKQKTQERVNQARAIIDRLRNEAIENRYGGNNG